MVPVEAPGRGLLALGGADFDADPGEIEVETAGAESLAAARRPADAPQPTEVFRGFRSACESLMPATVTRDAGSGGPPAVRTVVENPLLPSGIALTSANRRDRAGADQEDGVLTAEEAAALDLRGMEWP